MCDYFKLYDNLQEIIFPQHIQSVYLSRLHLLVPGYGAHQNDHHDDDQCAVQTDQISRQIKLHKFVLLWHVTICQILSYCVTG